MADLEEQHLVNLARAEAGRNSLAAARAKIRLDVNGYNERILTPLSSVQDIPKRTKREPNFGPSKHHPAYSSDNLYKAEGLASIQLLGEETITIAPLARPALLANLDKRLEGQYLSSLDNLDKERLDLEKTNGLTTARKEFRLCLIDLRRSQEALKHFLWLKCMFKLFLTGSVFKL